MRRATVTSLGALVALLLAMLPRAGRADDVTATAAPSPSAASSSTPAAAVATEAQDHYTAGRESYRVGLYGRALEEFERSLSLAPSPNTRLYLARTLRELGRWAEATDQYTLTVREAEQRGGRYLATRDAANVELADVKVRLERANASVAPAPPRKASTTDARSEATTPHHGPSTLAWVAGGVTLAGAASFGVLYGLASGRFGYLEDNCARVRTSSCDDARTTGKLEEAVSYGALGVALVAAAVTVYALVSPRADATATAAAPSAGLPPRGPWPLAF